MKRVEKHLVRNTSPWFPMLAEFCHLAKNLYNHANYIVRHEFFGSRKWTQYEELDRILKNDMEYPDYRAMPTAQSAQQTLRLLDTNWKSFFRAIKDWKSHKEKYLGMPRPPKYKKKDGFSVVILTNQNCRMKDGAIHFPKAFKGFTVRPRFCQRDFKSLQQVRFNPDGTNIVIEIIYEINDVKPKEDNERYAAIDLGVDNLATLVTNTGTRPLVISGKRLKSFNRFYNKELAERRSLCETMNKKHSSKHIRLLGKKRQRRIYDYMHKASKMIVQRCVEEDVSVIVIGKNKNWKQEADLGAVTNQNFVQIPFNQLIQMVQYKAENYGIAVLLHEESYTSGTSFLDGELPVKRNYDKSRRVHRGLFRANDGRTVNADVNGAFQIMRKVFPDVSADGIGGTVLCPVVALAV